MAIFSFPTHHESEGLIFSNFVFLEPNKENYRTWERVVVGDSAVFSFKSTPLQIFCARILGRGLAKSRDDLFDGNAALILYIDEVGAAELSTIDAYRITVLSETKEISSTEFGNFQKLCSSDPSLPPGEANDMFPYRAAVNSQICLAQTSHDFRFVERLAEEHPFGETSGQYSLVERIDGKNVAAVVVRAGRMSSKAHRAERRLFGRNLYALKEHSVHVGRLYSSAKNHLKHKHHADLISCIKYFARHLFSTPTTFISGVSYEYVPAAISSGAKAEFPFDPLDSIYYWYPLFMDAEAEENQNSSDIKMRYRALKAARDVARYWFISTDAQTLKMSVENNIWLLRDAPANTAKWRAISPGDPIFLSVGGATIDVVATVDRISRESVKGFERFPLGIHFSKVLTLRSPILVREETSKSWFNKLRSGGIFELPTDFALRIADDIRHTERKSEMWVSPNPYLLQGRDFEAKPKSVFVVQAWNLKDTVLPIIREICDREGYTVSHASDRQGQVIFEDIWIQINEAEAVLVDFTHKRPNVYLEYGMALVLGKPIISITQNAEDLPSDTPQLKYILYPGGIEGRAFLLEQIPKALRDTIADFAVLAERAGRNGFGS
jgi:hypothetical protein